MEAQMKAMKYATLVLFLVTCGCGPSIVLDKVSSKMHPPAGIQVTFRVLDANGYPVRPLTEKDVTVINDVKGEPFGAGQEGGGASQPGKPLEFEMYAVLALDMSDSIFNNEALDDVLMGAHTFVDRLVAEPEDDMKHKVGIMVFGRTEKIKMVQNFTDNPTTLHNALDKLANSKSLGTTNLYGAYMQAIEEIEKVNAGVDLVERSVVLLTDGTHEAGDEKNMRKQAMEAKKKSIEYFGTNFMSIGIRGAYDEKKLSELSSHDEYFVMAENAEELNKALGEVANRVEAIAHSSYVVGICTPVEMGEASLTIEVVVEDLSGSYTLAYPTDKLTGNITKCDPEDIASRKPPKEGATIEVEKEE
jgi:uncharacterized protein YegL